LVDAGRCLRLTNCKTARARWSQEHPEEAAKQLLLYHALASRLSDRPVELEFVVLTKTKEPTVERFTVAAQPVRVERTNRIAQRVWQATAAGHFFPSSSPTACGSCSYRQACRSTGRQGDAGQKRAIALVIQRSVRTETVELRSARPPA
jgi:hypothetical protein